MEGILCGIKPKEFFDEKTKRRKALCPEAVKKFRIFCGALTIILIVGVTYGKVAGDMTIHDICMWTLFPLLLICLLMGLPSRHKRKILSILHIDEHNTCRR